MKITDDNKAGLILCNQLSAKKLPEKDRVFVTSIMRQVLANPTSFSLSQKQQNWLKDIKRRSSAWKAKDARAGT